MSIILGIDYGDKRIGLALSDPEEKLARRFMTLKNDSREKIIEDLRSTVERENIEKIVIGTPIGFRGESEQTRRVDEFIKLIQEEIELPIAKMNEMLTSKMAEENLRMNGVKDIKAVLDQEAARIILQDYLDHQDTL